MNTIRVVVIGVLIGIIIAFGSVAAYIKFFRKTEKPQQPVQIVVNSKEQRRIDSLLFMLNSLNEKVDSTKRAIIFSKKVIQKQKKVISDVQNYADSLECLYKANKTIPRCDSTITAKNSVIKQQKTAIHQLDSVVKDYSRQVYLLDNKVELQSILISSKDSTITQLECAYNWKIKHKFWSWFLGWKCN
jgi:hypothetical protein